MSVKALAVSSLLYLSVAFPSSWVAGEERRGDAQSETPVVSIIRLIAACSEFQGKHVMTTGFAQFEFENFKICPSSEIVDTASCFWLRAGENGIPDQELGDLKDESRAFVTIEARVGCSKYLYSGYLDQIQLIVELETGRVLWTTDPAMKAEME